MTGAPEIPTPRELAPYVEALGEARALELFLTFGGSPLYIAENPTPKSSVAKVIGVDGAKALHRALSERETGSQNVRIPTAKPWIARQWRFRNELSVLEIARRLHVADKTVRGWLRDVDPAEPAQLDMF